MITQVEFSKLSQIKSGAEKLAEAVSSTLGPNGQGVLIHKKNMMPFITKDGVTVAESIFLEDPLQRIGADLLKEVARKTVDGAGDGTTTATILAHSIMSKGFRLMESKVNVIDMKKGIDQAVKAIVDELKKRSKKTSTVEELFNVANISTNGDTEMSKYISQSIKDVGKDGVVRVEDSNTEKTEVILNKGLNLERGFISHHFVNVPEKMMCEFKKPLILMTDKRISLFNEIIPALQVSAQSERPLLIICDDIEGEALATLIMNKKQSRANVCAIRVPFLSGQKNILLEDIAVATGGRVISEDSGLSLGKVVLSDFGKCEEVNISKSSTVIIDGAGDKKLIEDRINLIRNEITESKDEHETKRLKSRLAKINGGVATIYIGGHTETEINERKFRVEDAIYATIAAEEEGILPGGGIALYRASSVLDTLKFDNKDVQSGVQIIQEAVVAPLKKLCENSNKIFEIILQQINNNPSADMSFGWNAKTNQVGDMIEMGVVDPTKVVRLALENSASIVGLLLTTKAVIYEKDENN